MDALAHALSRLSLSQDARPHGARGPKAATA